MTAPGATFDRCICQIGAPRAKQGAATAWRRWRWAACLLMALGYIQCSFLLAGCRPAAALPTAAIATGIPTAIPTVRPIETTPETPWTTFTGQGFAVSLPSQWEVLADGGRELERALASEEARNPNLAGLMGGARGLADAAFWAYEPAVSGSSFADNLNVRFVSTDLAQTPSPRDAVGPMVEQYRALGLTVWEIRTDLEIDGLPATSITYQMPLTNTQDRLTRIEGQQYLVMAPRGLWVLTFVTGPGGLAAAAPDFERIASSFKAE